jgi:hypothetical protein
MGWQDDPVVAQNGGGQPAWMADPVVGQEQAAQEPAPEPPQESSFLGDLGRSAAMQGAAVVKGASNLFAIPGDTLTRLLNAAGITNWKPAAESINEALDSITPKPRNATERITNSVAQGLGGAAGGIGLGRAVGGALGTALAAEPGAQLAGAVGGSGASQVAAEAGSGPAGQLVAGAAGGMAGSAGLNAATRLTRGAYRGGEAGRQRMEQNIQAFEDAGASPSVGQATERRSMQAAESLLSRTPGAAGYVARQAEKQADDLGAGVERTASSLAPKASGEQAGRAIQRGITDQGGFLDTFKKKSGQLYGEIDQHIQPQTPVTVTQTQKVLAELTTPIKGAEATSRRLMNARISGIAEDFGVDAQSGAIPYEALRRLRTMVGEELADAPLKSDVPAAQWKRLYGALSSDLEAAAKSAGPDAERAFTRASNYYRAGSKRLDVVSGVIEKNGGPEAVFRSATSGTKEGATTIRAVMQSLPPDAQKMVSASVLRRLGRATAGRQDDLGERFSTETFLTNWNSMSPSAKAVLFDRYGAGFRKDMDQIAKVASNLREGSQVFRNPSGTAQAAAQTSAAVGFVAALATGNVGTAAAIAAGVGGANLSARLMTNPRFVKWLATTTKAPAGAAPALLNQLAQYDDPDIQAFVELAKEQEQSRNGQGNRKQ